MSNKLPLYHKLYQLILAIYRLVNNLPKQYKFSLGENLINLNWQCLDLLYEINILENKNKKDKILILSSCFDKIKLRLSVMQDLKIISEKQSAHFYDVYLREIGVMIGGWYKWANHIK